MLNIFLQKTNKVKLLFSLIKGVKNVSIYGVLCEGKKDKEEMKDYNETQQRNNTFKTHSSENTTEAKPHETQSSLS